MPHRGPRQEAQAMNASCASVVAWGVLRLRARLPAENLTASVPNLTANDLGLFEGGEIEAQMFNLLKMFIRILMFKFSTNTPLLQNPC